MAARRVAGHVIPVCTKASKELSEVRDRIRKVRRDISHMPESLELSDLADQVTRLSVKLECSRGLRSLLQGMASLFHHE